jgi:hypothetical protein
MSEAFVYLPEWRVLLCTCCGHCLQPRPDVWASHLRQQPHSLRAAQLKSLKELFGSYDLAAPDKVGVPKQNGAGPATAIHGLHVMDGWQCLVCVGGLTRNLETMKLHVSKAHQQKPSSHKDSPLWRACKLQTFFAENRLIRYFVVAEKGDDSCLDHARLGQSLGHEEERFFQQQAKDVHCAKEDGKAAANIVQGFDSHRSAVMPWLQRTGIKDCLEGLDKEQIQASFSLPKSADNEPELFLILEIMDEILSEAHSWCFDGPECMLTWPRQLALSRFHTATVGKARGFEPKKEPETVKTNRRYWKQFLTYYYRVIHSGSHFTTSGNSQRTPADSVQLTDEQDSAWAGVIRSARSQEREQLRESLSVFCMAIICHKFGGSRYSSPLLSFCAMHSVRPFTRTWKEAGNYNSFLSGLIWVVQLMIFHASVSLEKAGHGNTLDLIKGYCERFLQPETETPMGEILGWRLLLFTVSKDVVGTHQAEWDPEEKILTYGDVDLPMDQVPRLLLSEYTQAHQFLYTELMFGVQTLPRIQAWALKDNLDADTFGWCWGQHCENAVLLKGSATALLTAIQASKPLRDSFLDTADGGTKTWRQKAIDQYESTVEEFLKRLLVLIHMASGQPLRESELFSITWYNTQRRRNAYVKHGLVMLYTTYHKGQQQTGKFKDNIRFLPAAISDLLLDYLTWVIPLRQIFLRQSAPHAVISPYLWWKNGKVWADNRLTQCMKQACVRASTPKIGIAIWRQMTVTIVKTKFAADIACFDADQQASEEAEEIDADIRAMTSQRNHSTWTVNRAYANQQNNSFGNVWDGLIRRNLRASTLWKDFWDVDALLGSVSKRKRVDSDTDGPRLLKRIAQGIHRPRKKWSATALLKEARQLYQDTELQWKSTMQERAMVTVMSRTEQVVVVLGTGAGKSLLFMLPCALPDAGITILILPLVSLRGDLLRRVRELAIDHWIWTPHETRTAPLVFVSAEAAGTKAFRAYAYKLAAKGELERIVLDEAHFTITTSEYRAAMVDLALIRGVRTQFVYLTATLPPTMQAQFELQNNLVNPKIIRASTNRRNLFYLVEQVSGPGRLLEEGARKAKDAWEASQLLDQAQDKIILYVRTKEEAATLAELLCCSQYTADVGTAEQKEELLRTWLHSSDQPYIVATSALSAGFDYAHVRLVIHVDEPSSLIDFAQESGRAGRDGKEAYSLVLLARRWKPQAAKDTTVEKKALYRYLLGQDCRRTCLSAHLDAEPYWRQCQADEDVICDICSAGPARAASPTVLAPQPTGSTAISEKRRLASLELSRYQEDLLAVQGTCLLCRASGDAWDHTFPTCWRRFEFFETRNRVRNQGHRGPWIALYHACYWCYNPQAVCPRADPESGCQSCLYTDIVMPLCYGIFYGGSAQEWLFEQFQQRFDDIDEFLGWCGRSTNFGGGRAIWAVRVAAAALVQFELY